MVLVNCANMLLALVTVPDMHHLQGRPGVAANIAVPCAECLMQGL